uniref:CCHC-type domain-containing protein n=1 Tax=Tanacetum cinerariifolium TaxID=118510 RepID=A0A6L2LEB1_TANCI|nr:hypothetical protein [Tanacetum cinerariifolium]
MSTQQDIYATSSENHPPMLNKDNYVPWSSRIIRYARSRPNGKMIVDSIVNGPYELTEIDIKWMDADDQAIQAILLGLPEDIYAAVDSCETAKEIWERAQNATQNADVQSGGNQNGLVVVPGIANQSGTGNVAAARTEGTRIRNQSMCYNCRGLGHIARNCTARPKRRDAAYLQTQHASISGSQLDKAPVYDTDGSAKVHLNDNYYDNEIFNMFTQEEQYTDLLEPIPEPQLVSQNDNHVTYVAPSMVQSGVDQVAQVNLVNCNIRETNSELKSELASSAKQITTLNDEISNLNKQHSKEKSSISSLLEEKKKLKDDFKIQEDKFLDKEVDLEAIVKDLENILFKRDQTVQTMHMLNPMPDLFYHPNQKMALGYLNPSYLKKAQLKQQSLYNGNMLLEEHDPPTVYDLEETLKLVKRVVKKMRFLKKEIKPANYAKINRLSGVFIPQTTKSKEELFLSNISNMVTAYKMISILNKDLSDDTTPSVARKFLNEVKSSLVTLQRVVKQKMTWEVHNWSSSAHKEGTEGVIGLTQWSRSYMVELPCEDCYSGSCLGIAMENFEDNDDRQVLPKELVLMCDRTFPEESNRVEKYIGGLPDMIHDSVKATKPKTMQAAIEFATELIDKRIRDAVENKRKFEGTSGINQNQPQQNKRQNTCRAYAAGNSDRNMYIGSKPLCFKCDYHHEVLCPPRCNNYKRVGHLTRDCKSRPTNDNNNNNTNNNNRNNNNNTNNNNRNNNNNNQKGNVLEAMTIYFEVATIWVNQLGGSVWVDFKNGEWARPTGL